MNDKKSKKKPLRSSQSGQFCTVRDDSPERDTCAAGGIENAQTVIEHTPGAAQSSVVTIRDAGKQENSLPVLPGDPLLDRLHDVYGYEEIKQADTRFESKCIIGAGGGGRVFSVQDSELEREIAAKFATIPPAQSHRAIERFLKEARTMARLTHPNVVPVYDIGVTAHGDLFFTMKRVVGKSLGDAIREAGGGMRVPEIADPNDIVNIFLKVCEAVAYAHGKEIVHQDIKPDNIMLGEFGEVLLLDWGCSSSPTESDALSPGMVGTPAYMSPEQARREPISIQLDIYCIGASLFHALVLRCPASAKDTDEFWEKKRKGIIDPLTAGEKTRVPNALLEIALKAIDPIPSARYASADELAIDLRKYQAGRSISWRPFAKLEFTDQESLRQCWAACRCTDWRNLDMNPADAFSRTWVVSNGVLRGVSGTGFDDLVFRKKVRGNIRVKWKIRPLGKSENLNFFIAGENRLDGYLFHIGGFGDERQVVLTKGANQIVLDQQWFDEQLETGRWHLCEVEKVDMSLKLSIDGATVITCEDPDTLNGKGHQTFGFEVCNKCSYEIAEVEVFYQPMPSLISPIEVGDRFFDEHYYNDAIAYYEELMESHSETVLAERALFKIARCRKELNDLELAERAFKEFSARYPESELVPFCLLEIARIELQSGGPEAAGETIDKLAEKYQGHPVLRSLMFDFSQYYERYSKSTNPEKSKALLEMIAGKFALPLSRNNHLRFQAANLNRAGSYDRVLREYSYLDEECAEALLQTGRLGEVITRYPGLRSKCARAYLYMGKAEKVLAEYSDLHEECANALMNLNRNDEVVIRYPELRSQCAQALINLERFQDIVDNYRDQRWLCTVALMKLKRLDDALGFFSGDREIEAFVLFQKHQYKKVVDKLPEQGTLVAPSLIKLDKPEKVIERFGDNFKYAPDALIALGREREIPERFPQNRYLCAELLLNESKPEKVLALYPDQFIVCAKALTYMGRASEAAALYPSLRRVIAGALFSIGNFEEILESFTDQVYESASALISSGRSNEVFQRFTQNQAACARAALSIGDFIAVINNYPAECGQSARAYIMMGQFETAMEKCAAAHYFAPEALIDLGRIDELLETYFSSRNIRLRAFIISGKPQVVLERYCDEPAGCILAYIAMGKPEDAIARYRANPALWREILYAEYYLALRKLTVGDFLSGARLVDDLVKKKIDFDYHILMFPRFILPAFIKLLSGERAKATEDLIMVARDFPTHFSRRLWHQALFIAGQIGIDEFANQPFKRHSEAEFAICSAMRNELGQKESSLPLYQAYRSFPAWKKELHPVLDLFVEWRVAALSK